MQLRQIGTIYSPYKHHSDAPKQGRLRDDLFKIEIFNEFSKGLKDIEEARHLIVLYWCDRADREALCVVPPWDTKSHGVFATRSPSRPNPIAFDIVDFVKREGNVLYVKKMDALDGSPLLDIKPYSSRTDSILESEIAWFEECMSKE